MDELPSDRGGGSSVDGRSGHHGLSMRTVRMVLVRVTRGGVSYREDDLQKVDLNQRKVRKLLLDRSFIQGDDKSLPRVISITVEDLQ